MKKSECLEHERRRVLNRAHSTYVNGGQDEGESSRLMADLGHPAADDYRTLYGAWEALSVAAGHGERFVAYRDEYEHVTWTRPGLVVETNRAHYAAHLAVFGAKSACYPGIDYPGYLEYIRENARLGWPVEGGAALDPGVLTVLTRDYRLVARVFVAMKGKAEIGRSDVYSQGRDPDASHRVRLAHPAPSASQVLRVLAAVKSRMRRWMLPARTDADRAFDAAPLPIEQRPITYANVPALTVTDHHVLLPLIPLDARGARLALAVANDLVNLCRAEGYPYPGPAREWLDKFLARPAMKALDREFKAASR